jgi:hypothetical protein
LKIFSGKRSFVSVALTLRNEKDPDKSLSLTHEAWYRMLDLAEEYGWNPIGAFFPGDWHDYEIDFSSYFLGGVSFSSLSGNGSNGGRVVILEDALNLADALDQAFLEYEPPFVSASFFLFEPSDPNVRTYPGIGALAAVIDFCRMGSFTIEPHRR